MADIEALISSSLPFWERVVDVAGVVAGLLAVVAILVEIPGLVPDSIKVRFRFGMAAVLIVAVAGQISGTKMVTAITGQIIAFLNDRTQTAIKDAADANKLAAGAHERAAKANAEAAKANEAAARAYEEAGKANQEAARLKDRAAATEERAARLEVQAEELRSENTKFTASINKVGIQVGDRTMNEEERAKLRRALNGARYSITIVMIDDREARQYALTIFEALQKAGVQVRKEQIQSTSETGVIVCANSKREVKLMQALKSVSILSPKAPLRPEVCDRAITSQPAQTGLTMIADALFGSYQSAAEGRGTVVLVGQKRPLVR